MSSFSRGSDDRWPLYRPRDLDRGAGRGTNAPLRAASSPRTDDSAGTGTARRTNPNASARTNLHQEAADRRGEPAERAMRIHHLPRRVCALNCCSALTCRPAAGADAADLVRTVVHRVRHGDRRAHDAIERASKRSQSLRRCCTSASSDVLAGGRRPDRARCMRMLSQSGPQAHGCCRATPPPDRSPGQ